MSAMVQDLFDVDEHGDEQDGVGGNNETIEYVEVDDYNQLPEGNSSENTNIKRRKISSVDANKSSSSDDDDDDDDFSKAMLELGAAVGHLASALNKIGSALIKRKKKNKNK